MAVTWVDTTTDETLIAALWPDSTQIDPEIIVGLLEAAQDQCEEYLGHLVDTLDIYTDDPNREGFLLPRPRIKQAVILQARANFEAARPDGQIGDTYPMSSRTPLLKTIRNLLRPPSGIPVMW